LFSIRLHSFLPYYYSVDGKCKDGFTYVLYINGGHPPWGLLYPFFKAKIIYSQILFIKIFIFHNFFALIIFIIGAKLSTRTSIRRTGTRSWSTGYREVCKADNRRMDNTSAVRPKSDFCRISWISGPGIVSRPGCDLNLAKG
jgi:hypothetical protein